MAMEEAGGGAGSAPVPSKKGNNANTKKRRKRTSVNDMVGSVLRGSMVSNYHLDRLEDFEICELIGEGHYGVVHTMRERRTGQCRVVKTVMRPPNWDMQQVKMEAQILQNLDHPHILRIFAWYEDGPSVNIVMEHCMGGELPDVVQSGRVRGEDLPEPWAATGFRQCFEALVYIHLKGVIHKDLKGQNVMLLQSTESQDRIFYNMPHCVICDLGLAEIVSKNIVGGGMRARLIAGTPATMAPEVWSGSFGQKCDVWSLGAVLYEVFTGILPFMPERMDEELWQRCYRAGPDWSLMATSEDCRRLCGLLLTVAEVDRPTAAQALDHIWFRQSAHSCSKEDAEAMCNAIKHWQNRNPTQRAMCLKMACGCTCMKKLASLFSGFDRDSSGILDIHEVVAMLTSIGIDEALAKQSAAILDVNGDGSCEYVEFAAACLSSLEEQFDELLRQEFCSLDPVAKGVLATEKMEDLLAELRPIAQAHNLKLVELDLNGDGEVDFHEFCSYFGREQVQYKPTMKCSSISDPGSPSVIPAKEHIRIIGGELSVIKEELEKSCGGAVGQGEDEEVDGVEQPQMIVPGDQVVSRILQQMAKVQSPAQNANLVAQPVSATPSSSCQLQVGGEAPTRRLPSKEKKSTSASKGCSVDTALRWLKALGGSKAKRCSGDLPLRVSL